MSLFPTQYLLPISLMVALRRMSSSGDHSLFITRLSCNKTRNEFSLYLTVASIYLFFFCICLFIYFFCCCPLVCNFDSMRVCKLFKFTLIINELCILHYLASFLTVVNIFQLIDVSHPNSLALIFWGVDQLLYFRLPLIGIITFL